MNRLGVQLHVGRRAPTSRSRRFRKDFNKRLVSVVQKPMGGLWASTYVPDEGSAWTRWCEGEHWGCPPEAEGLWRGWLLRPRPQARVLVVDTLADLQALCARYPAPPLQLAPTGIFAEIPGLDFNALSKDADALHLTEDGEWRTRFTVPTLYGWDCESTVFFHWCFEGDAEAVTFPVRRDSPADTDSRCSPAPLVSPAPLQTTA